MENVFMILRTLAEFAVIVAMLFGFLHENRIVKVERKVFRFLKNLRRRLREKRERELEKELLQAQYAGENKTERHSQPQAKTAENGKKRRSSRNRVA